jgi:6-phosphofructokinase 1
VTDRFANIEFGSTAGASAARVLHQMATEHLGTRGEYQVPESLQMVGADRTSPLDLREAYRVGRAGVRAVLRGGGVMVTIERASNRPYRSAVGAIELEKPATGMKPMPDKFISADGHDVTAAFLTYLRPLVGDIPAYAALAGIGKKART